MDTHVNKLLGINDKQVKLNKIYGRYENRNVSLEVVLPKQLLIYRFFIIINLRRVKFHAMLGISS